MAYRYLISAALLLGAAGCEYDDPFDVSPMRAGPVSTQDSVVWLDAEAESFLFASPREDRVLMRRVDATLDRTKVAWFQPTLDRSRILAMLVPASERDEDVDERLLIFDGSGADDPVEISVDAPFSTASLSPDNRQAVLHFGDGNGTGVLQNANQAAIVDLLAGTSRQLTLGGFGGRLLSVQFPTASEDGSSTPVTIGTTPRDLIAFIADGEVVLVDAADAAADQVAIRFMPDVALSPTDLLLRRPNEKFPSPVLFLRDDTSADVAMLTLVDKPDPETGIPGFSAQVSLLPVPSAASDFVIHDSDDVPYLVTLGAGGFIFNDIRTQESFPISLEGDQATEMFIRTADTLAGPQPQLVAWARGSNVIHRLDLDGVDEALGRRPERFSITTGIEELVVLDNDRILVGSGQTLYVVDFVTEQVTPLSARAPYDPRASVLAGNSLLLGSTEWISTVDLTTLNPESMLLDDRIESFHYLPGLERIVTVHPDASGFVTVVDATAPTRASSYSQWGLFLESELDAKAGR